MRERPLRKSYFIIIITHDVDNKPRWSCWQVMLTGTEDSLIIRPAMENKEIDTQTVDTQASEDKQEISAKEEKKGLFGGLKESTKELISEVGILFIAGVMFMLPIVLWMINSGVFGKIYLAGRGGFSPFMDRLLILSIMFFILYAVSWVKSELKYRAVKVFGVMALLALLSIIAIQFDATLVATNAEYAPHLNKWFFTAPVYTLTSISAVLTSSYLYLGWQFYATLCAFLIASGVLLWDIKVELAESWKIAIVMWVSFEVLYLIALWIIIQFIGWPMFPPVAI
jgi:hypothetical protein